MASVGRRWVGSLLPACLAATAAAQEPAETPGFLETIDVRVIEVDVVVTDRQDNPVFGLTTEDFELFEDGKPVKITNFYALEAGRRREAPGETGGAAAGEALPVPREARTFVAVVVDSTTVPPGERRRAMDELREHLDRLVESTAGVMLVHLKTGSMTLETDFTTDRELLSQGVDRIEDTPVTTANSMMRDFVLREIERATPPPPPGGGDAGGGFAALSANDGSQEARSTINSVRSFANEAYHNLMVAHQNLGELVASLSGLPGRKAILYLSNGVELRPGELLFRVWWDKYESLAAEIGVTTVEAELSRYDATHQVHELAAHAAANSVAFYTMDAGGTSSPGMGAEISDFRTSAYVRQSSTDQLGNLQLLSASTGGLSHLYTSDMESLVDDMARGFESFYSLGYVSPQGSKPGSRRIEVKVRRDGLRARHPSRYLEKSGEELMNERTLAALMLDVADNPLQIGVELGEQRRQEKGRFVLPVVVKIPIANLTLLPEESHHVGRVSMVIVAQDRRGTSKPARVELPLNIPNDRLLGALGQSLGYAAELALRGGEQKIAIGVRDEIGQEDSTLNFVANVGRVLLRPQ